MSTSLPLPLKFPCSTTPAPSSTPPLRHALDPPTPFSHRPCVGPPLLHAAATTLKSTERHHRLPFSLTPVFAKKDLQESRHPSSPDLPSTPTDRITTDPPYFDCIAAADHVLWWVPPHLPSSSISWYLTTPTLPPCYRGHRWTSTTTAQLSPPPNTVVLAAFLHLVVAPLRGELRGLLPSLMLPPAEPPHLGHRAPADHRATVPGPHVVTATALARTAPSAWARRAIFGCWAEPGVLGLRPKMAHALFII
jgi:hypothetical protein